MMTSWTFGQRVGAGFAVLVLLTVLMGITASYALNNVVRSKDRVITGTSHLQFAPDGRVAVQRDHWDASFPVYGEFPLLGWVMRAIQRRAAIKPANGA